MNFTCDFLQYSKISICMAFQNSWVISVSFVSNLSMYKSHIRWCATNIFYYRIFRILETLQKGTLLYSIWGFFRCQHTFWFRMVPIRNWPRTILLLVQFPRMVCWIKVTLTKFINKSVIRFLSFNVIFNKYVLF